MGRPDHAEEEDEEGKPKPDPEAWLDVNWSNEGRRFALDTAVTSPDAADADLQRTRAHVDGSAAVAMEHRKHRRYPQRGDTPCLVPAVMEDLGRPGPALSAWVRAYARVGPDGHADPADVRGFWQGAQAIVQGTTARALLAAERPGLRAAAICRPCGAAQAAPPPAAE